MTDPLGGGIVLVVMHFYADERKQAEYQQRYQPSYQRRRYEEKHAALIAHLGGRCIRCGSLNDLQFDHVDPSTKCFSIMERWKLSIEDLAEELAKCQLLCHPCHAEKHAAVLAEHGTVRRYRQGCRQECCRRAVREQRQKYPRRRKRV